MSTALQVHTSAPTAHVGTFTEMMALANALVPTGFLPDHIKTPGQAVAIILQGRELGMEPMRALRSLTMVKGKVVENADSQLARFKDEGGRALFKALTDTAAELWLRHPNGDEHVERFTMKDAEAAGLTRPSRNGEPSMYTKFPKAMLRSRVITAGLKSLGWSGAVGNYDPDEAASFAPPSSLPANAVVSANGSGEEAAAVEQPSETVAAAAEESPAATEYQINKILELCDHAAVQENLAEAIRRRLKLGVTTARADQILVGLETEIRKATPAPAKAEPSVEDLNQEAEAASARVHAMTQRLNALLKSDRISPDIQNRVRERLAKSELTEDVLEQAIAELENVEVPF